MFCTFPLLEVLIYLFFVAALSDQPKFAEPIPNITVALGRDVSLPCVVENLGTYKVSFMHTFFHSKLIIN